MPFHPLRIGEKRKGTDADDDFDFKPAVKQSKTDSQSGTV